MRFSPDPVCTLTAPRSSPSSSPRSRTLRSSPAHDSSPSTSRSYASFRTPRESDEENDVTLLDYDTSDSEENNEAYAIGPNSDISASRRKQQQADDIIHIYNLTSHVDAWELYTSKIKEDSRKAAEIKAASSWQDYLAHIQEKKLSGKRRRREEVEREAEEVRKILEQTSLEKQKREKKTKSEFDNRNKQLWSRIEQSIQKTRQQRDATLKLQQEAHDRARKQQEEQERIEREQREAAERKIREERERNEKEKQEKVEKDMKAAAAKQKAQEAATAVQADTVSPKAEAEAQTYRDYLKNIRENVLTAVVANNSWKDYCLKTRLQIKPKIGQLVNFRTAVFKIANDLDSIITQAKGVSDIVGEWIMNFTAKAFVKQAETEVTVNLSTAYPLAHVCVLLFQRHPTFLDILMARFVKKCIYVIPQYVANQPRLTAQERLKAMGYKQKVENEWENDMQYTERMSGMLALWAAILQTTPEVGNNIYGISHGWTWLARIVNMTPRPITPALINTFLEIAGPALLQTYPRQLPKVLQLLMQQYIPLLAGNKEAVASTTRLKNYLEAYRRSGGKVLKGVEGRMYS